MLSTQDIDSGLSDKRDKLSFSPRTRKDYSAFSLLRNNKVAETRKNSDAWSCARQLFWPSKL